MTDQNALRANGKGMSRDEMYYRPDDKPMPDYDLAIRRLHQISRLAKIGVAATESALNIPHLDAAQDQLHEVIYRLATETLFIVEDVKSDIERAKLGL